MKIAPEPCPICGNPVDVEALHVTTGKHGRYAHRECYYPPLPAMPASVRELVDHCKADAHFPRHLIAAVEAHYAGGA